jgi:hypothetical protein
MHAFLLSTAVIFVAELGDKSQLLAMTFATRYRARHVLLGITIATAIVHLASVGIGRLVGHQFADSQWIINLIAGVAFLIFAAWTRRGDELSDNEATKAIRSRGAAVLAVGIAFFLEAPRTRHPDRSDRRVRDLRSHPHHRGPDLPLDHIGSEAGTAHPHDGSSTSLVRQSLISFGSPIQEPL